VHAIPPLGGARGFWEQLGWNPSQRQIDQYQRLQELLRQWNERLNLTRLVEGEDFWIGQIFDSLWPITPWLDGSCVTSIIDVGTGSGFPGLALAIAVPRARVCLVDSVGRKLEVVQAMAAELQLGERVCCRHERIECTGREESCRGRFELAVVRAVAPAPVAAEYLLPLLSAGGRALLYRGHWDEDDQGRLNRALLPLEAYQERIEQRHLPAGRGLRTAIALRSRHVCPDRYPRPVGVASKHPLGVP